MTFFLGTHKACWLTRTTVPLFLSRRTLAGRKGQPRALGPWALDSGGFTELSLGGAWRTTPAQYADEALRWADLIGRLEWAAVQDWMCEPIMLEKTRKSIEEHQALTIQSYLDLQALAPTVPWAPVLQGWVIDDYLDHARQYAEAGIDLRALAVVGVGSVCRRQGTREIEDLLRELDRLDLRLHAFGLKLRGLLEGSATLASADSMAWSLDARRSAPLPGCPHATCANCLRYALQWRERIGRILERPQQLRLEWPA